MSCAYDRSSVSQPVEAPAYTRMGDRRSAITSTHKQVRIKLRCIHPSSTRLAIIASSDNARSMFCCDRTCHRALVTFAKHESIYALQILLFL